MTDGWIHWSRSLDGRARPRLHVGQDLMHKIYNIYKHAKNTKYTNIQLYKIQNTRYTIMQNKQYGIKGF